MQRSPEKSFYVHHYGGEEKEWGQCEIMDIMDNVKEIAELAEKYKDEELNQKIMELENQILSLITQMRSLEEAHEEREKALSLIKKMQFRKPFYFQEDDPVPFCPHCWEREKNPVHLLGPVKVAAGFRYGCPSCKEYFLVGGGDASRSV